MLAGGVAGVFGFVDIHCHRHIGQGLRLRLRIVGLQVSRRPLPVLRPRVRPLLPLPRRAQAVPARGLVAD